MKSFINVTLYVPLLLVLLVLSCNPEGFQIKSNQEIAGAQNEIVANPSDTQSVAASLVAKKRVVIIAIDSMDPSYAFLNSEATGNGTGSDRLMPNVYNFVSKAAYFKNAKGHFPYATDMNHTDILSGSDSGTNGILEVAQHAISWNDNGTMNSQMFHLSNTRDINGNPISTIFKEVKNLVGASGKTFMISNKNWLADAYNPTATFNTSVNININGRRYPWYISAPQAYSTYDDPSTDPDWRCDPESSVEKHSFDPPGEPSDFWIASTALTVLKREKPVFSYIHMGDLDSSGHILGSLNDPSEWIVGPEPKLPPLCSMYDNKGNYKTKYRLVSKRNMNLFKEPILDLVRFVDGAFGKLINGIRAIPEYANAYIILVSDHNMTNFWDNENTVTTDINGQAKTLKACADPKGILIKAGLMTADQTNPGTFWDGRGPLMEFVWSDDYLLNTDPNVINKAKAELLSDNNKCVNPETGKLELLWDVYDLNDYANGIPTQGIAPMELYHPWYLNPFTPAKYHIWPDLIAVMKPHITNQGIVQQNAGHGAYDTSNIMFAIQGLGFQAGTTCINEATTSDVTPTIMARMGITPKDLTGVVGMPLDCVK